jgi:hypothetical protein
MRMRAISALALACLPVGCSLLAPQPDRSEVFVLTAVTERTERAGGALTVGIGHVVLPSYLDRAEIVRRSEENRLVFHDRGEPLERASGAYCVDLRQISAPPTSSSIPGPRVRGLDTRSPSRSCASRPTSAVRYRWTPAGKSGAGRRAPPSARSRASPRHHEMRRRRPWWRP